jgi:hypothetical protein
MINRFPTLAFILLVVGILWLLNDLKIIVVDIPWIPLALIAVSLGMISNRLFYYKNI